MKKLTKAQKKDYIKKSGVCCPACGSDEIEGGFVEIDSGHAWQPVGCNECDAEWNDIYNLVDVELTARP